MFGGRNCSGVLPPCYLSFLTASVSFLFCLVSVAGNSLVCLAVYKDPTRHLRTPFNVFVVNLACADLIIGLVVEPLAVAIHLKEGLADRPLDTEMKTLHMALFISCTASTLSLAALTIDRNIAIASPIYYRVRNNKRQALAALFAIWLISISLPCVYFKVGFISYFFVFSNTVVLLTFVILLASYQNILHRLKYFSGRIQQYLTEENARRKLAKQEKRVCKTFLLVLLAYLVCYAPSCVMIYVTNLCVSCSCYSIHWLRDTQSLLVLLNSCLNPLLYAWRLPHFRKAFAIVLHLRRSSRSVLTESSAVSARGLRDITNESKETKKIMESTGREGLPPAQLSEQAASHAKQEAKARESSV